jgi:hypothetical protein
LNEAARSIAKRLSFHKAAPSNETQQALASELLLRMGMREQYIADENELLPVAELSILKAESRVIACQQCSPSVSRPFRAVMVETLGGVAPFSDYVRILQTRCPSCDEPIDEGTLVRCDGELPETSVSSLRGQVSYADEKSLVFISERLLCEAEAFVSGCNRCVGNTELSFGHILDALTDSDPAKVEYVVCRPAKCPRCSNEVHESTCVSTSEGIEDWPPKQLGIVEYEELVRR